jgi:hypothetical protein
VSAPIVARCQRRRWTVETVCRFTGAWVAIYCTKTKAQATADAKAWAETMGQPCRIVRGDGHCFPVRWDDRAKAAADARGGA